MKVAPPNITLTQTNVSTKEYTKTINVNITSTGSEIAIVKYSAGERDISYFRENGTTLSGNSFTATSNDYMNKGGSNLTNMVYTVYAKDKVEGESVKTITLKNLLIHDYINGNRSAYAAYGGTINKTNGQITLPPNNTCQYGPYWTFPKGKYHIQYEVLNGEYLSYQSYASGVTPLFYETIGAGDYYITLNQNTDYVEFVTYNRSSSATAIISNIYITQIE